MKKTFSILAFLFFIMSTQAQTIIDYSNLWATQETQSRLELATYAVAMDILDTPADSMYSMKAAELVTKGVLDNLRRTITRAAITRQVDPGAVTDTQLKDGIRAIFIKEFWIEELLAGRITKAEYYTQTQ